MTIYSLNRVGNFVTNGEIAYYEQFLLLPQCFQILSDAELSESVCMWEMVKHVKLNICDDCADGNLWKHCVEGG